MKLLDFDQRRLRPELGSLLGVYREGFVLGWIDIDCERRTGVQYVLSSPANRLCRLGPAAVEVVEPGAFLGSPPRRRQVC